MTDYQIEVLTEAYAAASRYDHAERLADLADLLSMAADLHGRLGHVGQYADHADALHDMSIALDALAEAAAAYAEADTAAPTVTVRRLAAGESMADPASTSRRIMGPCVVTLTRWPDGGIDASVTDA